jgi:defect in organelle trafficking protein DotA
MNKIKGFILLYLLPTLTLAEGVGGVTFRPPETDVSIKLLGYIFGLVDGVLYGTGSQIVGEMFGIFNAAVLAIGAFVIAYTTVVSIVNTAYQGTVLGKKWSTFMVPLRSVVAVGLLIPKASGYCSIQIFVMWVVVQGVGAADTIWNQALGYLARGGVLIDSHAVSTPPTQADLNLDLYGGLDAGPGTSSIMQMGQGIRNALVDATGSSSDLAPTLTDKRIASGQILRNLICMYSLEKILRDKREQLMVSSNVQVAAVPAFINYINTLNTNGQPREEILFPPGVTDGTSSGPYYDFRGVCGHVTIAKFSSSDETKMVSNLEAAGITGLKKPDGSINGDHPLLTASKRARSIAVQQMIMELSSTASAIVGNMYWDTQTEQIAYRYQGLGSWSGTGDSRIWVGSAARDVVPMLGGYELVNAVNAYVALVRPTLRLVNNTISDTDYIGLAREQGWILAGSYFYNLVKGTDARQATQFKAGSVTASFSYDKTSLTSDTASCVYSSSGPCRLSYYLNGENATAGLSVSDINDSITPLAVNSYWNTAGGTNDQVEKYISAALSSQETRSASSGTRPSAVTLEVPSIPYLGSPILRCKPYLFLLNITRVLQSIGECIAYGIEVLGRFLGDRIIDLVNWIIIPPISIVFFKPLTSVDTIFNSGLAGSYEPGRNPIVELAKTGNVLMTLSINIMMGVLIWGIFAVLVGFIIGITIPIFLIIAPILLIICVALFGYGIMLAFYVPLIPYVIFTFASIGWFVSVIEAMVAAPIVALGLAHPEGHETLGKADSAVLLLANVFLRPSLLVMGFVIAIILSYVVITLFNAGFLRVNETLIDIISTPAGGTKWQLTTSTEGFSAFLAPLFMITVYVAVYVQLVEKSFEVIYLLPDQVLSWIGGQKQDSSGRMVMGANAQMKQDVSKTADTVQKGGEAGVAGAKKGGEMAMKAAKSAATQGADGGGEAAAGGGEAGGGDAEGGG